MFTSYLPSSAWADDGPADLVMGGQGSVAWSMGSIRPGDSGVKGVDIRNVGPSAAYLKLWISDVVETDHGGDGAALSKYLELTLEASGLQTDLTFPATIAQLPRYPSGENQLTIGPLDPGETVATKWNWKFVDNGMPQNDAQGDGISFTINYLLSEVPPPGESFSFIVFDMMGKETVAAVNSTGVLQQSFEATDPQGIHRISVPYGATILTSDGTVPTHIVLSEGDAAGNGNAPAGTTRVGPVFELRGYLGDDVPTKVYISPQAGLSLGVEATDLPADHEIVELYMLASNGSWSRLSGPSGASTSWEAHGYIGGTGTYAVFSRPLGSPDGLGAFLTARGLVVTPALDQKWWPIVLFTSSGGSATVSVIVTNEGPASGSYVLSLMVDGQAVDDEVVELGPGESRRVTFSVTGMADGEHNVRVAGLAGQFTTASTFEWPTIFAMIVVVTLLILFVARKRPEPKGIPDVLMADYKKRVLRELARQNLSFSALSNLTSIDELRLILVLEQLWKEGMIGTKFKDGNLVYEGAFTAPNLKKKT